MVFFLTSVSPSVSILHLWKPARYPHGILSTEKVKIKTSNAFKPVHPPSKSNMIYNGDFRTINFSFPNPNHLWNWIQISLHSWCIQSTTCPFNKNSDREKHGGRQRKRKKTFKSFHKYLIKTHSVALDRRRKKNRVKQGQTLWGCAAWMRTTSTSEEGADGGLHQAASAQCRKQEEVRCGRLKAPTKLSYILNLSGPVSYPHSHVAGNYLRGHSVSYKLTPPGDTESRVWYLGVQACKFSQVTQICCQIRKSYACTMIILSWKISKANMVNRLTLAAILPTIAHILLQGDFNSEVL